MGIHRQQNKIMHIRLLSRFLKQEIDVGDKSLYLRPPSSSDFSQWVNVRTASRDFLKPWEPLWPSDDLTAIGFKRRLRSYAHQRNNGTGRTYFLFTREKNKLIGGISLTRITHDVTRSAMLGYWMAGDYAGHGHMRKSVPAILGFAFNTLRLQRVEAACLPHNEVSINLLKRCNFRQEGYARQYLEINGKREDHVLFAILASEFAEQNT